MTLGQGGKTETEWRPLPGGGGLMYKEWMVGGSLGDPSILNGAVRGATCGALLLACRLPAYPGGYTRGATACLPASQTHTSTHPLPTHALCPIALCPIAWVAPCMQLSPPSPAHVAPPPTHTHNTHAPPLPPPHTRMHPTVGPGGIRVPPPTHTRMHPPVGPGGIRVPPHTHTHTHAPPIGPGGIRVRD